MNPPLKSLQTVEASLTALVVIVAAFFNEPIIESNGKSDYSFLHFIYFYLTNLTNVIYIDRIK